MSEILIFLAILLSRVIFLSISPAFFDSLEYISLFNSPTLTEALREVHCPVHPLWITIGWLFNKIPVSTTLFKIEFLNAILGTICCWLIYKIACEWMDKKKAILLTLICAFLPYFWLSQVNVLYEPLLGVFLLGSFWFLNKSYKPYGVYKINIALAGLFFAGAFLVSPTALIYLIFLAGVWGEKKDRGRLGIFGGLGILGGLIGYLVILRLRGIPVTELFTVLIAGNSIWEKIRLEGIMFFVRGIRNSWVVYFHYLTIPVGGLLGILAVLGFLGGRKKILTITWLVCFFLLNTIWHAGMFGRLSLWLFVAPVFLLSRFSGNLLRLMIVSLVIFSSFKVLPYHFQKIPYILEREYLENNFFQEKPFIVISNYEEPYLKETGFEYRVLNSPRTDLEEINVWLKEKIESDKIVLITSQAITAPYFQYDGREYQIISKKSKVLTAGQVLISNYNFEIEKEWPGLDIKIGRLNRKPVYAEINFAVGK